MEERTGEEMRPIEFQAFHPKLGLSNSFGLGGHPEWIMGDNTITLPYWSRAGTCKIMQYTGIKDCEGKKIFEGDIVKFTYWWFDGGERESELTGTIVYSDDLMSFQLKGIKNEEWERFTGHENDTEYLTPFSELNFEEADFKIINNIYE